MDLCRRSIFPYLTLVRKPHWSVLELGGPWSLWIAVEIAMDAAVELYSVNTTPSPPSHCPASPPHSLKSLLCKRKCNRKVKLSNSEVLLMHAVGLTKWYLKSAKDLWDQYNSLRDQLHLWHPHREMGKRWRSKVWVTGWGSYSLMSESRSFILLFWEGDLCDFRRALVLLSKCSLSFQREEKCLWKGNIYLCFLSFL